MQLLHRSETGQRPANLCRPASEPDLKLVPREWRLSVDTAHDGAPSLTLAPWN